jgi:hypothetical protein
MNRLFLLGTFSALFCFQMPAAVPPQLMLETVDADTSKPIPCLIRITNEKGLVKTAPGLLNRGLGLRKNHPATQWHCFEGLAKTKSISGNLTVEAFAGPEFEMAKDAVKIREGKGADLKLQLQRIAHPRKAGWRSGNTHLHIMKLTRAQADNYLKTVPRSDGLELVFVSNLRRAKAELEYITNEHRLADLKKLESADLRFGWGQEHRHNYGPGGQGYGHVMLLNIKKLVRPVSIGSGIMLQGTDAPPLQRGIRTARGQGATVIWCHNSFGLEDIPNWFSGTVDAQNIFDGGAHDSYEKTYYRYLNVGLRVPFSTGTDWFMYDFSRVYVKMDGELTPQRWLAALRKGRSYITNGPLLELRCGQKDIGDVIAIDKPRTLVFRGRVRGRNDFRKLQLIHNGKVVKEAATRKIGGHHAAIVNWTLKADGPGWVALRVDSGFATLPASAPVALKGKGVNEFGQGLFGHTSPIYIDYAGRRVFQPDTARALAKEMEAAVDEILKRSKFAGDAEKMQVLRVYTSGIEALEKRLKSSR